MGWIFCSVHSAHRVRDDGRGAAADESLPDRIPTGYPSASVVARTEAFRQGLRELGYLEGKNTLIDWRFAEGKADRLSFLAAELARLKVEVIVTSGPTVTRSAKEANIAVPIVMSLSCTIRSLPLLCAR